MEARVAKLEADVGHILKAIERIDRAIEGLRSDARTDFRLMFGAIIAVALGLATMMAKGFHWF